MLEITDEAIIGKLNGDKNLNNVVLTNANIKKVTSNLENAKFIGANLEGVNLEGVNLKGANFSQAILKNANLKGANLDGAILNKANLNGADFTGANFVNPVNINEYTNINFKNAILDKANFSDSNLVKCKFTGGIFNETIFNETIFKECTFTETTFTKSKFKEAEFIAEMLENTHFIKCNLEKAKLKGAVIRKNTSFTGCNLKNALLDNAVIGNADFTKTNLVNVTFQNYTNIGNIDFTDANFEYTNYEEIDFKRAILNKANFMKCTFVNCDFSEASLVEANFTNSKFQNTNLRNANLENAIFRNATKDESTTENLDIGNLSKQQKKEFKMSLIDKLNNADPNIEELIELIKSDEWYTEEVDKDGNSALMLACLKGMEDVALELIATGKNSMHFYNNENNILRVASQQNLKKVLDLFPKKNIIDVSKTGFDTIYQEDKVIRDHLEEDPNNIAVMINNNYYLTNKDAIRTQIADPTNIKYSCRRPGDRIIHYSEENIIYDTPYFSLSSLFGLQILITLEDAQEMGGEEDADEEDGENMFVIEKAITLPSIISQSFLDGVDGTGADHCQPGKETDVYVLFYAYAEEGATEVKQAVEESKGETEVNQITIFYKEHKYPIPIHDGITVEDLKILFLDYLKTNGIIAADKKFNVRFMFQGKILTDDYSLAEIKQNQFIIQAMINSVDARANIKKKTKRAKKINIKKKTIKKKKNKKLATRRRT
jgi:uncharacterized protein YjbI with pentapeptide repeats